MAADPFKINFSGADVADTGLTSGGSTSIDRSSWKFDEDGFPKAMNAALLAAQQEMREKIRSLNDDIVSMLHPSDYDVTVDGVPIDKATIEQ